jgi:hypothetical protein
MAASIRRPGCFWMVSGSGNGAVVHALGPAGQHFGSVALTGAVNTDWKDLASFTLDARTIFISTERRPAPLLRLKPADGISP